VNLSLLLIPALSGYWFLTKAYPSRYQVARLTGYHLFFYSAITGVILLTFARFITYGWESCTECEPYKKLWADFAPFDYSGTVFFVAVLALVLPRAINCFFSKQVEADKAAMRSGGLIESLLQQGMNEDRLIQMSLKSSRSYVGFAAESGVTAENRESDVAIIPLASGYRHPKTQELKLTLDYASAIEKVLLNGASNLEQYDLRIVFPKSEIASVRLFDMDVNRELSSHPAREEAKVSE